MRGAPRHAVVPLGWDARGHSCLPNRRAAVAPIPCSFPPIDVHQHAAYHTRRLPARMPQNSHEQKGSSLADWQGNELALHGSLNISTEGELGEGGDGWGVTGKGEMGGREREG